MLGTKLSDNTFHDRVVTSAVVQLGETAGTWFMVRPSIRIRFRLLGHAIKSVFGSGRDKTVQQ